MSSTVKIRFNSRNSAQFVEEVKVRVAEYFARTGRSSKANASMVLKTVILLGGAILVYGLILSNLFTPWQMLGLAVVLGIGLAGIGFAVSHDALHGAYSANPTVNRLVGYSFDLMGANGYMWKITHNVIHHTYTNIPGVDEDLTIAPFIRLSPAEPWKPVHRLQHIFAFFAYSFATFNWLFVKDFKCFMAENLGPYRGKKHARSEWVTLILTRIAVFAWSIVIPLLVLDVTWWQFLIGFMAMHLTAGLILGVIFQLAHVVEGTEYPEPDEKGNMENTWLVHEMITTANFAHSNKLLSWYIGGLNYQIEHHLFPQVCSVHYPAISSIVKEVATKYDIPYNLQPTLRSAVASHYAMLKRLGQPDPVPARQVRVELACVWLLSLDWGSALF